MRPVDLADLVRHDYFVAILSDCRVAGMIRNRVSELALFSNQFVRWNFRFWGCEVPAVETEFGLAYRADGLTAADAQRLIELYLPVVTTDLTLSASEASAIRAELERLAQAAVVDLTEDEFSMSVCEPPRGGAGGAAGAGGAGGATGGGGVSGGPEAGAAGADGASGGAGNAAGGASGMGNGAAGA